MLSERGNAVDLLMEAFKALRNEADNCDGESAACYARRCNHSELGKLSDDIRIHLATYWDVWL